MKISWPVFIGALFCFLFFAPFQPILAQVKINEFSSATSSDWVEFYNNSDEKINLTTYTLVDGSTSGNPKTFSCSLEPKGFWVVDWSSNLNNSGDIIKLKNGDQVVDCVTYGNWTSSFCEGQTQATLPEIKKNEFGARSEDGAESWKVVSINTKNSPNNGAAKDPAATCLAPSPSPSPSPSPGASPSPNPTTSSSSQTTVSPSPIPTPSASPQPSKIFRIKDIILLQPETPEPVLGTSSGQTSTSPQIDWP
ncbi:MAG: lamin tail domain-containing protein, partial [bacterium]|nr:lamin tail domain-containing protein [bacterium]